MGSKKKKRKGGIGEMGWGEGGKAEMEAKEVRYVGKLQRGRKFLSEFRAHTRHKLKNEEEGGHCGRKNPNGGV